MGRKATIKKVVNVVLDGGYMPEQSVEYSAGYDLYVPYNTAIKRGRQAIPIGIKIGLPQGIDGHIRPRSGFLSREWKVTPFRDSSGSNRKRSGLMPMLSKALLTTDIKTR